LSATLIATAVGCGDPTPPPADAPSASSAAAPSAPSPTVDPAAAFKHYEEALLPFNCSTAAYDIGEAAANGDIEAMKKHALEYQKLLAAWNDRLGAIDLPTAAQPMVDKMRDLIATERADLDVVRAAGQDADLTALSNRIGFDDWSLVAESDRVVAALGQPEHPARLAANQLELAYQSFNTEIAGVWDAFDDALGRNDLTAAKAANATEAAATQRYIDRLDAIDFPAGFESRVGALRDSLRGIIEYNRRQVDVATAADIARTPDDGAPAALAADEQQAALFNDLKRLAADADPAPAC
jgi:hypothetical protein